MLYILECILACLSAAVGAKDSIMQTTGEFPTWKDLWIGVAGWFAILIIITAAIFLYRHFKYK